MVFPLPSTSSAGRRNFSMQ